MDIQYIRIQNKGLVTLPKSFRQELGIEANSLAKVSREGGKIIIEPVRTLPYRVRSYKSSEVEEILKEDTKISKELRKKKIL